MIVVFLLASCKGGGAIDDATFVPGSIPGTGEITFSSDLGGEARAQLGLKGEALDVATPSVPAADGRIPVLGLQTGKAYEFQVVIDDGKKETESEVAEFTAAPPSRDLPPVRVASSDPSKMCDPDGGYVLFSFLGAGKSGVAIIDREANYVWTVTLDDPAVQVGRVRPGRDGKSILWNTADAARCKDIATIVRQPMDGSAPTVTRTLQAHHDFIETEDGRLGWLGYDIRLANPPGGQDRDVLVAADVIYESDEGLAEVGSEDTVFNTWEHYPDPPGIYTIPPDSIGNAGKPAFLCPSGEPEWGGNAYEFGHANSLAYRESDDSYFMVWRWLDTMIKADRANPQSPYVWEMGGEYETLPFDESSGERFYHAHMSDVFDGGMVMLDNRERFLEDGTEGTSRVVEYAFDDQGWNQVWEYESDKYEAILGDVRRIPVEGCDNLLVSFSNQGRMVEITREGEIVWDVTSSVNDVIARVTYLPDIYDFSGAAYPE